MNKNLNEKNNTKSKITLIIVVAIVTLLVAQLIYFIADEIYYSMNKTEYMVNNFTEFKCSKDNELLTCNIDVNKTNFHIDYFSLTLYLDSNIEYIEGKSSNNLSVTESKYEDKTRLQISSYDEYLITEDSKNIVSISFKINKEIENSTISLDNLFLFIYNDKDDITYRLDNELIVNINQLTSDTSNNIDFSKLNCFKDNNKINCELLFENTNFTINSISFDIESSNILERYESSFSENITVNNIFKNNSSYEINDLYIKDKKNSVITFIYPYSKDFHIKISNLRIKDYNDNIYSNNEIIVDNLSK